MASATEELWRNERQARKSLILWSLTIVCFGLLVLATLCFWLTQPMLFAARNVDPNVSVDPNQLKIHVEKLSIEYSPRSASFVGNLNKSADYIKREFQIAGANVSEQAFEINGEIYRNIIARFNADSPEIIVVGAHYDAAGAKPAADDNASGVAGLIELARLLGKTKLGVAVELVAYTLEEPPFFGTTQMGSFVHAQSLANNRTPMRLMIALEMIGYFSDEPNSQKYPVSLLGLLYPSQGNFIAVVGNFTNVSVVRNVKSIMLGATDLPVRSMNAFDFVNGVDFSDHRNYWTFGFNAVMITDTAFYRNPNYHTAQDTAEKLDYNRMAQVVEAVFAVIVETAK